MPFRPTFRDEGCELLEHDILNLIWLRNGYDFPRAYMRFSALPAPFVLGPGVWAKPVHPSPGEVTDFRLDEYHRNLLRDPEPMENLLGCASVVYWGYYTFKHGYAVNKLTWFLEGYRSRPATTADAIARTLALFDEASAPGEALGLLAETSQLGQVPFASKIVTKHSPDIAGVMDNQLFKGLQCRAWAQGAPFLRLGSVRIKLSQAAYTAWCAFLCNLKDKLNAGIAAGMPWHWTDTDGTRRVWRAVDVERALFRYIQLKKNNPDLLNRSLIHPLIDAA